MKPAAIFLAISLAAGAAEDQSILGLAYASPPEIAADALLRLAASDKVAGNQAKLKLIEQAFILAASARLRYRFRAIAGAPADSRAGALGRAARLGLDTLSLRTRAVRAVLAIDKTKAREMFDRIEAPQPEARSCQDALVFDLTDYYALLSDIAGQTFDAAERRLEQHLAYVRPYVMSITSSVQVALAVRLVRTMAATPPQRDLLVASLASALANVASDSRSFLETGSAATAEISALAETCRGEGVAIDGLREAFDRYVQRQSDGLGCEAEGDVVIDLGAALGIPPKPGQPSRAANNPRYWTSAASQAMLTRGLKLRWGPSGVPAKPLTLEERRTIEWQEQLAEALKALAGWTPAPDETEVDYFHQRSLFYETLVELTPPGAARDGVIAAFLGFLSSSPIQRESPAEWLSHVVETLARLQLAGDAGAARLADAFGRSGNPALALTARLESLAPRPPLTVGR